MENTLKNMKVVELDRENLETISGGLGTLPIIYTAGGIATLACAYMGICDTIHGMGLKIGKALAK